MKNLSVILVLIFAVSLISAKDPYEEYEVDESETDQNSYDIDLTLKNFIRGKFDSKLMRKVETVLHEMEKQCKNHSREIRDAADNGYKCLLNKGLFELNTANSLCSIARAYFEECSQPLRKLIASCLPPDSKELPEISGKIGLSLLNELCGTTIEQVLELLNPCQFNNQFTDIKSCSEIENIANSLTGIIPTKSFLCTILPTCRDCSKERHSESCSNPCTKTAYSHFYEAIVTGIKPVCTDPAKNEV